jgi:tetratricopeptide (TPR) repeat protein
MVNCTHESRPLPESKSGRSGRALVLLGVLVSLSSATAFARGPSPQQSDAIALEGTVRNSAGEPVAGASMLLEEKGQSIPAETKTNADGTFVLFFRRSGIYTLRAEKSGFRNAVTDSLVLSAGERKHVNVTLEALGAANRNFSGTPTPSSPGAMEFEDKPNFTIAGVTDWTAAGGHGSDTNLRTSEALAKETLALKSDGAKEPPSGTPEGAALSREKNESENKLRAALVQAPGSFEANHQLGKFYFLSERYRDALPLLEAAYQINPASHAAAYDLALACKASGDFARAGDLVRNMLAKENKADLHRLLGDLDERLDDPLGAVLEYEQAARLDPSEQNYFEWGAELLLHRAIQPAAEVFGKGSGAHPKSARMLSGLGAALYASGSYDEAALRLCAASDLRPADPTPYLFLGKMERAAPRALPCVERKMARFVKDQPGNALANYHYAMALWKRQTGPGNPTGLQQVEALLERAVTIDPKFDEAYLQLGILYSARGNLEQAIGAYKRASELNPHLGEAHYRLGAAYKRLGKEAEAEQEFQTHEQIEKTEAAAIDRQRREVRQFLIVLRGQPEASPTH